jgi:hypothetical protein
MSGSVVLLLTFRNDTYRSVPHTLFLSLQRISYDICINCRILRNIWLTDKEITSRGKENMGIVMFTVRTSMCNLAGQDIDGTREIRWWIDRRLFYDVEPSCNVLQRQTTREKGHVPCTWMDRNGSDLTSFQLLRDIRLEELKRTT